jgi:hypothetical protein
MMKVTCKVHYIIVGKMSVVCGKGVRRAHEYVRQWKVSLEAGN